MWSGRNDAPRRNRRSISAGAALATGLACKFYGTFKDISMQVVVTGSPTVGVCLLEGTVNGSDYSEIGRFTHGTDTSGKPVVSGNVPCVAARCRIETAFDNSATINADIAWA